jgi:hypothetical protein
MTDMNITKAHVSIGTLIVVVPMLAGAALWYEGKNDAEHAEIQFAASAGDVELSIQQINLELKLLRTIAERRVLTADELDRKDYLEALREIMVAEQKKRIA